MWLFPPLVTILLSVEGTPSTALNSKQDLPSEFNFPCSTLTPQEPELKTFKAKAH